MVRIHDELCTPFPFSLFRVHERTECLLVLVHVPRFGRERSYELAICRETECDIVAFPLPCRPPSKRKHAGRAGGKHTDSSESTIPLDTAFKAQSLPAMKKTTCSSVAEKKVERWKRRPILNRCLTFFFPGKRDDAKGIFGFRTLSSAL